MDILLFGVIVLLYLLVILYLGYRGWRATKDASDYMVAGRKISPYVMALSYGATFISTSAIVGFGGTAGQFGMGLLWLTFLNIFIGIFVAFVFYGKRTRKIGHNIGALTFPEIMSKRFDSKFIQYFSGLVIFLGMPLYVSVVLIGAGRFIEEIFQIDFITALLGFSLITTLYVVLGGLKGVMYTDAFQGTLMLAGMSILLVMAYSHPDVGGGVSAAHQALTDLSGNVPEKLAAIGHTGWTSMPAAGSPWWWSLVSTIVLGVGIGVLAMPQLAVRFMTVRSNRELNRAVAVGGIFILMMTGVAFVVGALSNVYFMNTQGLIAQDAAKGNVDSIIPIFINSIMPDWFVYLFMLTLLAAAMSTVSSQIHAQGTSIARDVYETLAGQRNRTIMVTRMGILVAVLVAVGLGMVLPDNIIARGTAIFFGLCAAAFLPMYTAALFWKRATKEGAIAGLLTGTFASVAWLVFFHQKEAAALGISKMIFGVDYLLGNVSLLGIQVPMHFVDPIVIALPISALFTVLVSYLTKPPSRMHLDKCFRGV